MKFTRTRTRGAAGAIGLALFALSLTGCAGGSGGGGGADASAASAESSTGAETLVITRDADPTSFDPSKSVATGSGLETLSAFYDRLVDVTPDGEVVPSLAESWEISDDGLAYTFHLQEGVTFHDGSPFTADEVRFTWERIMGMNVEGAQYWGNVKDVEVVDPLTAVIHLSQPDATFLSVLGGQRASYIGPNQACVEANETTPGDWAADYMTDHECGTGPYTLDSWEHDQQITFNAFEDYWKGWDGEHVTSVVQKIVSEPSTIQLLMGKGEVDLAGDNLPMQTLQQLEGQEGVTVDVADSTTIDMIVFNLKDGPTTDPKVREAISLLFDYDAAIEQAYAGQAERIGSVLPNTLWPEVTADIEPVTRDVEQAKKLLAEAGYPDGFEIDFSYADINQWGSLALILEASLKEGGITVKPNPSTWPVLFEKIGDKKDYGLAGFQMWAAIPDPNDILMWWKSDATDILQPGWGDAETDALIDEALHSNDRDERVEAYQKVVTQMSEDMPAIWVDQPKQQTAFRDYVQGFEYNPYYNGLLDFYALSKTA